MCILYYYFYQNCRNFPGSIITSGLPKSFLDDFNFHITNFPFLSSNIPSSPAYGVFISQLIRYSRACSSYECFILRARRLSSKLLKQGYLAERLKSSFRKFYGRYGDLIQQYEVSLSRMLNDILILDQQWPPNQSDIPPISWPLYRAWPSPIMSGFHGAFATGVASQQGTLTLPDTWFRPPFWDSLMLQLLRPNSSNLPCLCSTFHLEYPLVLSRFCFLPLPMYHCRWTICPRGYLSGSNYRWMTRKGNMKVAETSPTIKRSRTAVPPETWFRPPFWDLLMLQLLRPNSSNLPCLCSTFHLEYPLVLSRFCF